MFVSISRAPARTRVNVILVGIFFVLLMLFGGASRDDVLSLPIARLASVVMILVAAVQLDREEWRSIRVPVFFLLAVAAVIAVQLIPLPPEMWASLAGRSRFLPALSEAGIDHVWRPLSLTPDWTLNSLLAVLPPLAAVLAMGLIGPAHGRIMLPLLLGAVALNAVVGLLQVSGAAPHFYSITNAGSAVGFFSNRNHLALLLAVALPLLACWAAMPHADPAYRRLRAWLTLCVAAAIFPLLLATGSRGGLIVGAVATLLALAIGAGARRLGGGLFPARGPGRLLAYVPLAIGAAAVAGALLLSRDEALQRLLAGSEIEQRRDFLPTYVEMIRDFFPFGSGFGSFDPLFRAYEPQETLALAYMNEAHNDFAQLAIEGGLFAILVAGAFLVWAAIWSWRLWAGRLHGSAELLGRTGSAIVLLLLIGSAVDYPLRTPFMAAVMAMACCWMWAGVARERRARPAKSELGSHQALG